MEAPIEIPTEVATCPYCKSKLWAVIEGEVLVNGIWLADQITTECESEPQDMEAQEWDSWLQAHTYMPYVYQMPVDLKIIKWINKSKKTNDNISETI